MTSKGINVEEFKLSATVKKAAGAGINAGQQGGDNSLGELDSDDEYDLELVVDEMEEAAKKAASATAYEHANIDILRTTEGEDARVARALKKAQRRKEGLDTDNDDDEEEEGKEDGGVDGSSSSSRRSAGNGFSGRGGGGGRAGSGGGGAAAGAAGSAGGRSGGAAVDEASILFIQFKAMANKFGYQQDTLEFAKHWVTLDAGQRLALMDRFYG